VIVVVAAVVVLAGAATALALADPFFWSAEQDVTQGEGDGTGDLVQQPETSEDFKGELVWMKCYGGNSFDAFVSAVSTLDGGFVTVGSSDSSDGDLPGNRGSSDSIIAKFDADGNKLWLKSYGGSSGDSFSSVILTPDGGFVAVGDSASSDGDLSGNRGGYDFVIAKFDENGNKLWLRSYGGSGYDSFSSVSLTPDGGFVAVGFSFSSNGDLSGNGGGGENFVIAKFDADGNKFWIKTYGGSDSDRFSSITPTLDGGFVAVGNSDSSDGDLPGNRGSSDSIIAKFDADGNKLWLKSYGGSSSDSFSSVTSTSDGTFVVQGWSRSSDGDFSDNKSGSDFIIAKFDADGNKLWLKSYGENSEDTSFSSVIPTPDGGFVAAGHFNEYGRLSDDWSGYDFAIAKFDADGNKLWLKTYGGSSYDFLYSAAPTPSGAFVAVGWSDSSDGDLSGNRGDEDFIIARFE
jgi:hypothetical protein